MPAISAEIARLRARIADIEKRPPLSGPANGDLAPGTRHLVDSPRGSLHEVFSDDLRNSGTALGFAIGHARSLIEPARPALIFVQLVHEAAEVGLPYGPGLMQFGVDNEALMLVRAEGITELLWAIEEAVACGSVAGVIADIAVPHKALDFTVSRRLALRAQAAGTSVYLVRYGNGREASAARYRWRVMPAASAAPPFDARAPGNPRFSVTLEKGRIGGLREGAVLNLDWTKENGFAFVDPGKDRDLAAPRRGPAAPRPQPAALGDRLSQAS